APSLAPGCEALHDGRSPLGRARRGRKRHQALEVPLRPTWELPDLRVLDPLPRLRVPPSLRRPAHRWSLGARSTWRSRSLHGHRCSRSPPARWTSRPCWSSLGPRRPHASHPCNSVLGT
ncbi:unnamed protein product, partial [Durusdinium trenchii]